MDRAQLKEYHKQVSDEIKRSVEHLLGLPYSRGVAREHLERTITTCVLSLVQKLDRKSVIIFDKNLTSDEGINHLITAALRSVRDSILSQCKVIVVLQSECEPFAPLFTKAHSPVYVVFSEKTVRSYDLRMIEDSVIVNAELQIEGTAIVPTRIDVTFIPPKVVEVIDLSNARV